MQNKKKVNEIGEDVFGRCPTEELLVELDRIGVPAGRIRSIREVYDWSRHDRRDCRSTSTTARWDPSHCPAPAALLRRRRHRSHAHRSSPAARARRRQRHRVRLAATGSGPVTRLGAREFAGLLTDGGTWESWDLVAGDAGASVDYADALLDSVPGVTSDEIDSTRPRHRHRHRHRLHCKPIK